MKWKISRFLKDFIDQDTHPIGTIFIHPRIAENNYKYDEIIEYKVLEWAGDYLCVETIRDSYYRNLKYSYWLSRYNFPRESTPIKSVEERIPNATSIYD